MCLVLNVFRSDVAQFFQPSIDCIVKAVLEQKGSAHNMISVGSLHVIIQISLYKLFPVFFSMSCSWAGLPRVTGCSPKYMNYLLPLD
jgi:hypothetical protein